MFYDVFKKLCEERSINPTRASVEIGFSRGSVSYWKKRYQEGFDAKPDSYTAGKIADYFGVSVDYLLGRTDDRNDGANGNPAVEDAPNDHPATVPNFASKFAMLDDIDKVKAEAYLDGLLSSDKYR